MKKSKLLIAALAVLVSASITGAEEIKVDFDGGRRAVFSSVPELKAATAESKEAVPAPAYAEAALNGEAFPVNQLDAIILADIAVTDKAGKKLITAALRNLLGKGSVDEKTAYVAAVGVYTFSEKFVPAEKIAVSGGWTYGPEYQESESEVSQISAGKVCRIITRRFCRLACRMVAGMGSGYEECRTECRNIIEKACDNMKACPR